MSEKNAVYRLLGSMILGLGLAGAPCAESDRPMLDPTRPSGWQDADGGTVQSTQRPSNPLRLQATFSHAGARSAMISGKRVGVGDEVSGAEVIAINHNKVTLRIDGETVELASLLPSVKSPANKKGDGR